MCGSIRRESLNRRLLSLAEGVAENSTGYFQVSFLDIRRLPFYDGDKEVVDTPAEVVRAKKAVSECDGLAIATPEYNGAPSGVLQNALDWLSRPWGDSPLTGKPVVTLSASPGPEGGRTAQERLRGILMRCGAEPLGDPLAVPCADWLWDPQPTRFDSVLAGRVRTLLDSLASASRPLAGSA
ncbi:NADPH-dependent FMN reductase [Streptomyces montanisoli]|uniref:NADPH-dependent FMN reductase n=1 Tax=Streptomyces montanisoli TaxID=2798581 RepID=UPI0024AEF845|nr:NADPH-dependent FMN reductase [Streptomyces montanisoli]